MSETHSAFQALGPVDWESFSQEDPKVLMTDIFENAHCLVNSIPKSSRDKSPEPIDTEPLSVSEECLEKANRLRKEWKEVKVNARDNPLGLSVYKMSAKDGKGAWFARRSVHEKVDFKKWKTGMEREFAESLKVQGQPGDGKIRGLGADKCVVDQTVDGRGKMQVYQLSAQFPGPTSPRDFVTLCLSSDTTTLTSAPNGVGEGSSFILVSKPCVHSECPERQGFIRGYYESVEFIRVIATDPSPSESNSPNGTDEAPATNNDKCDGPGDNQETSQEGGSSVIEWTMITRSDPGGSVPRFIIEKKTPEGITQDANKFFQWISSQSLDELANEDYASPLTITDTTRNAASLKISSDISNSTSSTPKTCQPKATIGTTGQNVAESPGPGGVYGMISGALGMVASVAASRLLGPADEDESEPELSSPNLSDDNSSIHSFHSLEDTKDTETSAKIVGDEESTLSGGKSVAGDSTLSAESTPVGSSRHDKELKKLEERRRKTEEKLQRARERALSKKDDDAQRDELAMQKLREKHEREKAKQEEKYQRERRKLEEKRANDEKKAEERRRKQAEREQKANLALELEKVRAERDIARREAAILAEQIGQLQAMNTKLVARLGREGISLEDSLTPTSGGSGGLTPGKFSRSTSEVIPNKTVDGGIKS